MKKMDINTESFTAVNSQMNVITIDDVKCLNVVKNKEILEFDEPTYAKINGIEFQNGTIKAKLYSKLLSDAPDFARGFIGIAFRTNKDDSKFECIYLRPTNGRTDDINRINNAVQYFSYSEYKFDLLRQTSPGVYEAPVDIGLDEWISVEIKVDNNTAVLFVNDSNEPVLTVNDLKQGISSGGIGLWCDVGTNAFFKDIEIILE